MAEAKGDESAQRNGEGRDADAGSSSASNDPVKEATVSKGVRKRPRWPKVLGIVAGVLVGVAVAAIVGVNVFVRVAYAPFYQQAEAAFPIPGINSGFVCQDLDRLEHGDAWLFSGYTTDSRPSPVYRRSADGSVQRLLLAAPDGELYDGHGSAITSSGRYVYVACEGGLLVFEESDLVNAADGDTVLALGKIDLDFTPSFGNVEGEYLLVGNFYRAGNYETPGEHRIATPDGSQNPAVIYAYPLSDTAQWGLADALEAVLSIPERIQGTCLTADGRIVLSQSYGLATSHLLAYDTARLIQDGAFTADGQEVPLYCLDSRSLVTDVAAPPMTEGIESYEGRVYVSEESASNRYIFGKLYGAGTVYALDMD